MLFKEITGQYAVKQRLIRSVKDNRVSHAQLFYGPQGSGKLALAIAYAQFINCGDRQEQDDGLMDACGTCPSCVKYNKLAHPDLHFIYPVATTKSVTSKPKSSNFISEWRKALLDNHFILSLNDWYKTIGIEKKQGIINADDCSDILKTLSYKSYESEFKVMVIWMVDKLFHSAAPKILKILEEPPDKTLFLLISENPDQIINTIRSRTQMVRIPKLKDEDVIKILESRHGLETAPSEKIAALADGNIIEALSISDHAEDHDDFAEHFIRWMRLCYKYDISELNLFVSEISKQGREKQKRFLQYASGMIRNSMLINYHLMDHARMNEREMDFLLNFSRSINEKNLARISEELDKAQYHIERNANPNFTFMGLSQNLTQLLKSP